MVPKGHAGCPEGFRRPQITRPNRREAGQAAPPPTVRREAKNRRRRDSPAPRCWLYYGSIFSRVACQPSLGIEEEQQVAHVYRLHQPQQGLPQRSVCFARIDQVIDSTAGCELLSFLDAYSGYHQIKLDPADRLKTAFITPFGGFCYLTMTFGLRNAGATFQRCMQKCLLKQLGRKMPTSM